MVKSESSTDLKELDLFHLDMIYPDATTLFATQTKAAQDIKDNCLVVLDTNVLLLPYGTGTQSLSEIETVYKALITQERLLIPGQVAREFVKNRADKLTDLHKAVVDTKSKLSLLGIQNYPLFHNFSEFEKLAKQEGELKSSIQQYLQHIDKLIEHIRAWNWDDPVSKLYNQLFNSEVVYETTFNKVDIQSELDQRYKNNIPPGYKDQAKPDKGIGDLLVWFTLLEAAQSKALNVLFVSGEQKPDWYHKSGGHALYPRFELIQEFSAKTGGKSFQMVTFSKFLELFGANESVVKEIKKEEENEFSGLAGLVLNQPSPTKIKKFKNAVIKLTAILDELKNFLNTKQHENYANNYKLEVGHQKQMSEIQFRKELQFQYIETYRTSILSILSDLAAIPEENSRFSEVLWYTQSIWDLQVLVDYLTVIKDDLL